MSIVSYAQNFEDVMLWRALGHVEHGLYIDIGAQDPVIDSVSKAFHEHGWRGIHVEPATHYAELLKKQRPGDRIIQAAVGAKKGILPFFEIPHTGISTADASIAKQHRERGYDVHETSVPCITLATVFKKCQSQDIHWLKIDVEGFEEQVLRSWGADKARPWIVVVESTLPLTQIESHERWEGLLFSRSYEAVYFDGLNRFYIASDHPELKPKFAVPPNVFDGFRLNGTGSSSIHQLIAARHQSETNQALEKHTLDKQDLQAEIERLSLDAAMLRTAQDRLEEEKISAALEHERQAQSLHADHLAQEAALIQKLETLEDERLSQQQRHASFEESMAHQTEQATQQIAKLLQTNIEMVEAHLLEKTQLLSVSKSQEEISANQLKEAKLQISELQERAEVLNKQHTEVAAQLRTQLDKTQETYLKRERELTDRLVDAQRQSALENTEQVRSFLLQERALLAQHSAHQEQLTSKLKTSELKVEQLARNFAERERQHLAIQDELQTKIDNAFNAHVQLQTELTGQLLINQQRATKTSEEQALKHLELERELRAQLAQLTDKSSAEIRQLHVELAQRNNHWKEIEYSLNKDLQNLRHEAQTLKDSGAQAELRHNHVLQTELSERARLLEAWSALEMQLRREIALEKSASLRFGKALEDTQNQLIATRTSFSWRITGPLRKLALLFNLHSESLLNQSASEAEQTSDFLQPARSAVPLTVWAVPPPETITSKLSEPSMSISTHNTAASSSKVALTLVDLLARYDEEFVECAYQTLLGRAPDAEGRAYYLGRLRTGISKMRTVTQLCESSEGKMKSAKLPGLDDAIRKFKLREHPFLGWFVRQFSATNSANSFDCQLRAVENQIGLFRAETKSRFDTLDNTLSVLHHAMFQSVQTSVYDLADVSTHLPNREQANFEVTTTPDRYNKLSPKARDIYLQLKTAAAMHSRRAA